MNADQFFEFLNFFQKYARASIDNPVLLILDNHESHLSIKGLDFCKDNGIVVLSLPPHTSHKLQPLDRSVFGPFKRLVNTKCDIWESSPDNVGKTIKINDIPGIINGTLDRAASNENIRAGFECTGICPLNENRFTELDFAPSIVTDRALIPADVDNVDEEEGFFNESFTSIAAFEEVLPAGAGRTSTPLPTNNEASNMSTSNMSTSNMSTASNEDILNATLESIRPLPKAQPRKKSTRGRKKRRSEILTSSPV